MMWLKASFFVLFSMALFADYDWDGKHYHVNSASQQNTASKLYEQFPFKGDEKILDLGCGDGKITAAMAELVSQGSVLGIDLSSSQIEFANKHYASDHVTFAINDIVKLPYDHVFDVATAFTSLQWVEDQLSALQAIHRSLKKDGKLLIAGPIGITWQLSEAVCEVISKDQWKPFSFKDKQYFFSREAYASLLRKAGFTIETFKILPHPRTFKDKQAFIDFVKQWLPFVQDVPLELRDAFMNQIADVYIKLLPAQDSDEVVFDLYVYNIIARS